MDKKQIALELSEELLGEIELRKIDDYSAILKCLRIARLTGDDKAIEWLQYETGGYNAINNQVSPAAYSIAREHGRVLVENGKEVMFGELVGELISLIETSKTTINNLTNASISVEGELALLTVRDRNNYVSSSTNRLMDNIKIYESKLAKLRSQYYDYALRINIELRFSNKVANVFYQYQKNVDTEFIGLSSKIINKLNAVEENLNSDNSEVFSQVLTTCRRLFQDVSDVLFNKYFPNYSSATYKTKSNKEINIDGDHYLNRLSAVIERLQDKSANKTLIGSTVIHTIDWIENLNNLQCKGVHTEITKDEALRCIIHTYICLGDILNAQEHD